MEPHLKETRLVHVFSLTLARNLCSSSQDGYLVNPRRLAGFFQHLLLCNCIRKLLIDYNVEEDNSFYIVQFITYLVIKFIKYRVRDADFRQGHGYEDTE